MNDVSLFAVFFSCFLGSVLILLWGITHLDDNRRYGATAIGLSILLFIGGWFVMFFPWPW